MTDLKESMSRMLEDEPALPVIADQVIAAARIKQRRRRYGSGAAMMVSVAAVWPVLRSRRQARTPAMEP